MLHLSKDQDLQLRPAVHVKSWCWVSGKWYGRTSKDLLEIMVPHLGKLVSTFRPPSMDNVVLCTCSMEGEQAFTRLGSFQSAPPSSVGNQLYRATCLFLDYEHATCLVGLKYVGLHTQRVGAGCRGGELAPNPGCGVNDCMVSLGSPTCIPAACPYMGELRGHYWSVPG